MATVVEGDLKAPFSIVTTKRCRGGRYSFPWIAPLYLDPYFIMLSVKQGSIKYRFFFWSLWYDLTWDWTQVFWAIVELSNYYADVYLSIYTHTHTHQKMDATLSSLQKYIKKKSHPIQYIDTFFIPIFFSPSYKTLSQNAFYFYFFFVPGKKVLFLKN